MNPIRLFLAALIATLVVAAPIQTNADANFIVLQSTTSTKNSGLYDHLLPLFTKKTGIEVRVVAVGTGQALKNAKNGDGDVLLVHAKQDEEAFVAGGFGVKRHNLMYNDFVIVGPPQDPARISGAGSAATALAKIAQVKAPFASRGDNSGTHKKELQLWQAAGVDPKPASGDWYRELGSGMGATLNAAVVMNAYTLTDRGTWLSFKNRGQHKIVSEGDKALFNQYGVILVNPAKHPHVRVKQAQALIDWLVGPEGQDAIAAFKLGGKQLFFPNAGKEGS